METSRLLLRPWRDDDLAPYARICADPEVMRYMSADGAPWTRARAADHLGRLMRHWDARGFGQWAAEERATGALVGRVGLLYQDDFAGDEHKTEVGWLFDRACWGRGLATEGAVASVSYGFEELGLERIVSIMRPENRASRRVAEKVGLSLREQTRWRDQDMVWYAIDRRTWTGSRV